MYNAYIETYGCAANQNNTEIMAGLLERAGFNVVSNKNISDIAIINTCIVKGPTLERMIDRIKKLKSKSLIVAGCMPDVEAAQITQLAPKASLLGSHHIKEIVKVAKALIEEKRLVLIKHSNEVKLCMPKMRQNPIIGITQISEGCVGSCTFCIVRKAKRKLFSYPAEAIIKNVKRDLEAGCKEIWLTSQDDGAYGLDNGKRELPQLLNSILLLSGRFYVRLGMVNPNNALPILNEFIECYKNKNKNKKLFRFLHLPLQSGSDKILKDMNREYKVKDFVKIIESFRNVIPDLTLSTDVICGYPTETKIDFAKTLTLIKKIKPDIINISRFWPMPGTKASMLKQISVKEIKKRSSELMSLSSNIFLAKNRKLIGLRCKCLIDKKGFNGTWLSRNSSYKLIVLRSRENLLGKIVDVKVTNAMPHYLIGEII